MSRGLAKPPRDIAALRARIAKIRLPGGESAQLKRAKALLDVYLKTAQAHGQEFTATARSLRAGLPALRIAGAELEAQARRPDGLAAAAACTAGCAFCCILSGTDGGVLTEEEARAVHKALVPLKGARDGRAWHKNACPALDPGTRMCRIYEARPMICRTYLSTDAKACESISQGVAAPGPGVLSAQGLLLTVQSLARAALKGMVQVPSYSLARVASEALAGSDEAAALKAARHAPKVLEDERARLGGAL